MAPPRRLQQSFGDGLIREEVSDLWEPWMPYADQVLNDDSLGDIVQTALATFALTIPRRSSLFS